MNVPEGVAVAVATAGAAALVAGQELSQAVGAGRPTGEIIQIIGVVTTSILAILAVLSPLILQWIAAKVKTVVAAEVAPVVVALAAVDAKAVQIGVKVDGTASRMEDALKAALTDNARLREDKAEQKEVAAVLAATTAAVPLVAAAVAVQVLPESPL